MFNGGVPGTLVISINASWNVVNFRRGLVEALRGHGWRVVALTPNDAWSPRLVDLGAEHVAITIDSAGLSPLRDLALLGRYRSALKRTSPQVFLGYTAKPNVWGSLAAHSLGIPVINNISGLGTAFVEPGPLRRVLTTLYRLALKRSSAVFFQNPDDLDLFLMEGIVKPEQARLLPGSGIDIERFRPPPARAPGPFSFLFLGRLLWQKGVREYVEAARIVKSKHPAIRFRMLGFLDSANRSAVTREEVEGWQAEGLIDYLGSADDVRPHVGAADCVVLPSWREGLPRSLLEGAAMGRPLIATDVPGCRHAVEHEVNGFLCAPRDSQSLAQAMERMVNLSEADRTALGAAGRRRVERDFSEKSVIDAYLQAIGDIVNRR
jgi:glycosyltransferase involved in cell wall biosynthesis